MHTQRDSWFALAIQPTVIRRGLMYAVIVGVVLITINHGDALLRGELTQGRLLKMALTVIVPYVVSTLSSVGAIRTKSRPMASES
ncbi:MAG: nitrate/nitrite transporter NrtS [Phycisphaerales bacterium JB047]